MSYISPSLRWALRCAADLLISELKRLPFLRGLQVAPCTLKCALWNFLLFNINRFLLGCSAR